jgi:hypothetical protein
MSLTSPRLLRGIREFCIARLARFASTFGDEIAPIALALRLRALCRVVHRRM